MRQLSAEHLSALLSHRQPPCISLYQPTHRHHPENQQDPVRYRNLLRTMEASLREKHPARDIRPLLEMFEPMSRDGAFWNRRTDGLAVLGAPGWLQVFDLQRPVRELLVVADSFHTKPLLRVMQSADRYQVLCMSLREARLYEGNRDALDPVDLSDVPSTMAEALGSATPAPDRRKDDADNDMVRFFRVVDRAILKHHSRPGGLPLMLAALPEHHAPFRAASHNPFLMAEGLMLNPEAMTADQLRGEAWRTVEPLYLARLRELVDAYQAARARRQGSDDVGEVARAAIAGRVGTLLVEADRIVPGRIDPATGKVVPGSLSDPGIDDVLDDLAEIVLRAQGEVVVVPAERMPSGAGIAATFRF